MRGLMQGIIWQTCATQDGPRRIFNMTTCCSTLLAKGLEACRNLMWVQLSCSAWRNDSSGEIPKATQSMFGESIMGLGSDLEAMADELEKAQKAKDVCKAQIEAKMKARPTLTVGDSAERDAYTTLNSPD